MNNIKLNLLPFIPVYRKIRKCLLSYYSCFSQTSKYPNIQTTLFPLSYLLIFLLTIYSCSHSRGPIDYPEDSFPFVNQAFYFDPLIFFDSDSLKPRLDLYIEVPAENIIFKLNDENRKYESFLTIIVSIENKNRKPVLTRQYDNKLSYSKDEMVKFSKDPQFYLYNYYIEPGEYKLDIKIKDANSNKDYAKPYYFTVKDFGTDDIAISDIMLLSQYKISGKGTKEITPLISGNIYNFRDFHIFFELYNRKDSVVNYEYLFRVKDKENKVLKEEMFYRALTPGINKEFEKISLAKELSKYNPEEPDFDFYLFNPEEPIYFRLELIEKPENKVIAEKKLYFIPGRKQNMELQKEYER